VTHNAHSTRTWSRFGDDPNVLQEWLFSRSGKITTDDGDELQQAEIGSYLANGAHFILAACQAGEGKGERNNLANMFGRLIPQAHIWSNQVIGIAELAFDENGLVNGAQFFADRLYNNTRFNSACRKSEDIVYHIEPRPDQIAFKRSMR
jgi:hypothetical protein